MLTSHRALGQGICCCLMGNCQKAVCGPLVQCRCGCEGTKWAQDMLLHGCLMSGQGKALHLVRAEKLWICFGCGWMALNGLLEASAPCPESWWIAHWNQGVSGTPDTPGAKTYRLGSNLILAYAKKHFFLETLHLLSISCKPGCHPCGAVACAL